MNRCPICAADALRVTVCPYGGQGSRVVCIDCQAAFDFNPGPSASRVPAVAGLEQNAALSEKMREVFRDGVAVFGPGDWWKFVETAFPPFADHLLALAEAEAFRTFGPLLGEGLAGYGVERAADGPPVLWLRIVTSDGPRVLCIQDGARIVHVSGRD